MTGDTQLVDDDTAGQDDPDRRHEPVSLSQGAAESGRMEWLIQCQDALQRDRSVTVRTTDGDVLIVGPPGETVVLDAGQLKQFRSALEQAAKLVERRR